MGGPGKREDPEGRDEVISQRSGRSAGVSAKVWVFAGILLP